MVGYQLDEVHYLGEDRGGERGTRDGGRRGEVVYLLPGGLVGTGEMMGGRVLGDGDGWE